MEPEAALIGRGGLLLLGMAGDQRGVEVQDQTGQSASRGPNRGYALTVLSGLHPGPHPFQWRIAAIRVTIGGHQRKAG
jgi:hypothetical protein